MYMRSGASTGVSTQCDLLVLIDFLACGYQNLAQMAITGHLTIRMTDGEEARTAVPFGTAQSIPLCIRPQRHLKVDVMVPPVIGLI